jgi:type I restriction enzyme, S subunit
MSQKTKHGLTPMDVDRSMGLCEGWCGCRLTDIAEIKGGKRLPAGEQFSEEETPFPYIRVTDMVNGTINDRELVYVKSVIEPLIRNYKISSQDLYVTIAGTLGQFGRIPEHLDGAQLTENAAKITKIDTGRVDINFLCQYLRSEQVSKQVDIATGTGGGVPKLPLYQIEQFLIQHPSLPEQAKISEILSTVDRAIEQTDVLIAKQQRIKTGLMQDLLTRGIDEHGNLRSEQTHKFKDSPLGRIPVEWEARKISDVSTQVTDGDHQTPKRNPSGFYLLSARNVNDGYIDLSDVDYVSTSEYERMIRRCNPEAGDILISCSGTIGRVSEIPKWLKCVLVRSAALIKFSREAINSRFAEWMMRSFIVQLQIRAAQRQAAQPNLFQGEIENLKVLIPKIEEQQRIAGTLDSLKTDISSCQIKLGKLCSLKTALMQDLLTGKKRVPSLLVAREVATL